MRSSSAFSLVSSPALWLLLLAVPFVPISLLWDFSWESTVGVDLFWSPPHTTTFVAVALALLGALSLMRITKDASTSRPCASSFGPVASPLGASLVAWAAFAFVTAVVFDRWWQSAYGLQAGIWHPPQILKAIAFFAIIGGLWLLTSSAQNESVSSPCVAATMFSAAGGCLLLMIAIVTLTASYPNWQHSASFYKTAAAMYPLLLVALATAGGLRWSASLAALVYTLLLAGMLWLLPLFKAQPLTGPIYNRLDHLMPPPFPLLLIIPALLVDWFAKQFPWPGWRGADWLRAVVLGLAFFLPFFGVQWFFSQFLLTPHAHNWFFAGGGANWPFFLKTSPPARTMFWNSRTDMMNWNNALIAVALSFISARLGLWLGSWLKKIRR